MDQVDVLITSRIDMNRCFPYNFTLQYSSRNYTGANSFGAPEAKAIKGYLEKINSSSTEMIVLDFHGWMNFTQGNAEIGRYFGSQFGFGHNNGYSSGFFSSWASTLKNTKAVLIEYPTSTHSYSDVITGNYIGKTFNGIINVLKNNPGVSGGGSTGSEETPMAKSGKVINVTSNLNVRSDSSTSSNIIGSLAASAFVTIVAKKDNFYKICYGTGFGYVSKDYIQIVDGNTLTFDEIKIIQEDLKRLGIFSGAASGYYDSLTEFAVREFQLRYNIIPANGVANEETRNAIKKALTTDVLYLIRQLELVAKNFMEYEYKQAPIKVINELTLNFLRYFKYKGMEWSATLGKSSDSFVRYVKGDKQDLYDKIYKYIRNDPKNDDSNLYNFIIDLPHLAATIQGYTSSPIVPDFWTGWGGDLATAMKDVTNLIEGKDYKNNPSGAAKHVIGNKGFTFELLDIYADIDAIKLADLAKTAKLSDALENYYKNHCNSSNRCKYIVEDIMGKSTQNITEDILTRQIITRMTGIDEKVGLLKMKAGDPEENVLNNTCRAFAQYIIYKL